MSFIEKRDFERVTVNTAMSLSYGNPPKRAEGLCYDLSEVSLGIKVRKPIPLGTECKITIHDGNDNRSEFQALIEIIRIQEVGKDIFLLGANILHKN